jgi:hypothetical protein
MFVEDIAAFFPDFGVDALLAGASVRVIFDDAYLQASVGPIGMASSQPVVVIATASVPAEPVGLLLVVGAKSYQVAAHEPDGTGTSRLLLEGPL